MHAKGHAKLTISILDVTQPINFPVFNRVRSGPSKTRFDCLQHPWFQLKLGLYLSISGFVVPVILVGYLLQHFSLERNTSLQWCLSSRLERRVRLWVKIVSKVRVKTTSPAKFQSLMYPRLSVVVPRHWGHWPRALRTLSRSFLGWPGPTLRLGVSSLPGGRLESGPRSSGAWRPRSGSSWSGCWYGSRSTR